MKNLVWLAVFILLSAGLRAQESYNYEAVWKTIDSLTEKGLPQSALEKLDKLQLRAKTDNNHAQKIKSQLYRIRLESDYQEGYYESAIYSLEKEVKTETFPCSNVIHSILGQLYWNYFNNNRYRFYNRTDMQQSDSDDLKTWTLQQIMRKAVEHYQLSLNDETKLAAISSKDFDPVWEQTNYYLPFETSLLDLLGNRALVFYSNDEVFITTPVDEFVINGKEYLGTINDFLSVKIQSKDTFSSTALSLGIFQKLLNANNTASKQYAQTWFDLNRLRYVRSKMIDKENNEWYREALENKYQLLNTNESKSMTGYELAQYYYNQGKAWNGEMDDKRKMLIVKAYELCNEVIALGKDLYGGYNCLALRENILKPSFSVFSEEVAVSNNSYLLKTSYTNIGKLYYRLIKISYSEWESLNENMTFQERVRKLTLHKSLLSKEFTMNPANDYQTHSTEFILDGQAPGLYIMLFSNNAGFLGDSNTTSIKPIQISDLAFINENSYYDANETSMMVTNRKTGEPVNGAVIKLYESKYNYITRRYTKSLYKSLTTDVNGIAVLKHDGKNYRYLSPEISYNSDFLKVDATVAMYERYEDNKTQPVTYFFADRGIYRPGQTVYFKGIMLNETAGEYSINPGKKTTVIFYDANYQRVSSLDLTANEYGSFSGSFIIPATGLTGRMSVGNSSGTLYFNVEEYKRPKFYSEFLPVNGNYRLGEKVNIKGKALAYAGFPVDGAEVTYSVVRTARFPYWNRYCFYSMPYSAEAVIANGKAKTDDNGIYSFDFNLIPDESVSKKMRPYFTYQITASVTDLNGETRSATTWVNAAYEALEIGSDLSGEMIDGGNAKFEIFTKNLNGKTIPTSVKMSLTEIRNPEKYYFAALWKRPEFALEKEMYNTTFPNVEYNEENNPALWEKGSKIYEKTFDSGIDSVFVFTNLAPVKSGMYLLEMEAVDVYGFPVKYQQFVTYIDKKANTPVLNDILRITQLKQTAEPGETVEFLLSSALDKMMVYYTLEAKDGQKISKWIALSKEQKILSIPVTENFRGGFGLRFIAISHNRSYSFTYNVNVPYTNRQLDFEYETFRDKLEPGQNEKWKIKITGAKGDKVAAEMLATMYDASLDAFMPNYWNFSIDRYFYSSRGWDINGIGSVSSDAGSFIYSKNGTYAITLPRLNWFGYPMYAGYYDYYSYRESDDGDYSEVVLMDQTVSTVSKGRGKGTGGGAGNGPGYMSMAGAKKEDKNAEEKISLISGGTPSQFGDASGESGMVDINGLESKQVIDGKDSRGFENIELRSNFSETAFFFPQLRTDENGAVIIEFTIPQSLTKWNFKAFAHTKDLKNGFTQNTTTTSKSLMVIPNAPRFLRENDEIVFTAKISNLSNTSLQGQAMLELIDPMTGKDLSKMFGLNTTIVSFSSDSGKSTQVSWRLKVPQYVSAVSYHIKAKAGNFTDGEEMTLPVLTNRILVTETLPLWVKGNEKRSFEFTKLVNSNTSKTLSSQQLTLEFSPNPVWYAVQALPYMMEYPYECAEQTFNRYYANSIAAFIVNKNPEIKKVFEQWETLDTAAFLSNLEKNQELKNLLLEETPWVMQAQNEQERKKRIALLFNFSRMEKELGQTFTKLEKLQVSNGGFPWYKGMPDDEYVTQLIVAGFGHLRKLGIEPQKNSREEKMIQQAVAYIDARMKESYDDIVKYYPKFKTEQHIGYYHVQYLYARSFYPEMEIAQKYKVAYDYFVAQAESYWTQFNKLGQGQIALSLERLAKPKTPADIVKSLRETSLYKDEMGMYWRDVESGYNWWQAPVETQSVLVEVFKDVAKDTLAVENLQTWLLKQKQVQDWKTTKATADACYALLIQGTKLSSEIPDYEITVGSEKIGPNSAIKQESGTGYLKTSWDRTKIKPEMGKITIDKRSKGIAWGAMYWQYFEDLDNITSAATPLKIKKILFLSKNTNEGTKLIPINEGSPITVGDKVVVRIEVSVDRAMNYVHMKDMRASCFEPTAVISTYRYQSGVGYYENTRDASVNYFFSYLPKGTFVFEYTMNATHEGTFSNGITTIQCMYAPEFSSHSEGLKVIVKP